jgi:nitrate reductase NapE component
VHNHADSQNPNLANPKHKNNIILSLITVIYIYGWVMNIFVWAYWIIVNYVEGIGIRIGVWRGFGIFDRIILGRFRCRLLEEEELGGLVVL